MHTNPKRSGEILLLKVDAIPEGKTTKHKNFVIGHSETGHHHVLEATLPFEVTETEVGEMYIKLFGDAAVVHKKATDKHRNLKIPAGLYKRFQDTEYSPFDGIIHQVKD